MIKINKNSNNFVALTLREKSQLFNNSGLTPYYVFEFVSQQTNEVITFVAQDLSTGCTLTRYDSFNIIETGSTFVNLQNGTINLNPAYFWEYTIYENQFSGDTNPANFIGQVEVGKVFVSGSTNTFNFTTYSNNSPQTFITYTNNTST